MKRIFIALKVEAGETLLNLISTLKSGLRNENVKWTCLENIHITLAFLGDTEEKLISNISTLLRKECEGFGNFELVIKGAGVFKNISDPRVLWTGIEPSDKLTELNALITNVLKNADGNIEIRAFRPHLTIGRIKYIKNKVLLKTFIDKYKNAEFQREQISELILYESILSHSGPVYRPLGIFKL